VAVHGDVLFELAADRLLGVLQPHRCATAYRTCAAGLVLVGCCDGSAEEGIGSAEEGIVLLAEADGVYHGSERTRVAVVTAVFRKDVAGRVQYFRVGKDEHAWEGVWCGSVDAGHGTAQQLKRPQLRGQLRGVLFCRLRVCLHVLQKVCETYSVSNRTATPSDTTPTHPCAHTCMCTSACAQE
jgi:hypothetical protein